MKLKSVHKNLLFLLLALVISFGVDFTLSQSINPYLFSIIVYASINVILSVSLNLVNGITGQFSMGHAGFMAVGAYTSAFLSTTYHSSLIGSGVPEILCFTLYLLAAGISAGFVGFLVGLPSLRLRGDYLAIVTLGFGEIVRVIVLNINAVGGARGLPGIPKLTTLTTVIFLAYICIFFISRLMRSRHGRSLLAIREDEIAAESTGVNTVWYKVFAFVFGAFFAGLAGSLFAHFLTYLNPQTFDFNKSFEIIIMVVLGGMGSTSGAVIAALFLTVLREALRPLQEITGVDLRMVIYSLMLVLLMLYRPKGFFGTKEIHHYFKKKERV